MATGCKWHQDDGVNQKYHGEEWGIPVHGDGKHFELLMMEAIQYGLNWTMILGRREIFRQCFDSFGYEKIVRYDGKKIQETVETPGMIRFPREIQAIITDARAYLEVIQEYGSFNKFLQSYADGGTLVYRGYQRYPITSNDVPDAVSKELKRKSFKYLGPITAYFHLQACDMISDHRESCFLYRQLCDGNSVKYRD